MQIWHIAVLVALMVAAVIFHLLRKMCSDHLSTAELNRWIDINWRSYRPLERLLDPSEFEFLRKSGMSDTKLREWRSRRRALFRMYIRRLVCDFHTTERALCVLMARGPTDNAGLARELAKQHFVFYRNLLSVELRLMVNRLGLDTAPAVSLLRPLELLHAELRMLAQAAVPERA